MFGEMVPAGAGQKASDRRYGENPYRRVFGLSRNDADWLLANAGHKNDLNEVWQELGKRYGFIWTTVREVAGEDIGKSDPWLVTAEVESIVPVGAGVPGLDDDDLGKLGWLLGSRWTTVDLVLLGIALGVGLGKSPWGGFAIVVAWIVVSILTCPQTSPLFMERKDD